MYENMWECVYTAWRGAVVAKLLVAQNILRQVAGQDQTALSMAFSKARFVEMRDVGFNTLEDFANPANPRFFDAR